MFSPSSLYWLLKLLAATVYVPTYFLIYFSCLDDPGYELGNPVMNFLNFYTPFVLQHIRGF